MHVLAVVAQGHRLGRRSVLDVTELVDEPLLRLNSTFASHGWFEAACQVAHIRPRVLLESVAPQTLIALARTGHGVAVVPSPVRIPRYRCPGGGVGASRRVDRTMDCRGLGVCGASRHPMLCNSSKSWSTIAGEAIRARTTVGTHRYYRGHKRGDLPTGAPSRASNETIGRAQPAPAHAIKSRPPQPVRAKRRSAPLRSPWTSSDG